jgi:hypothetical protein
MWFKALSRMGMVESSLFFIRFKIGAEGPFQFSWRDLYTGAEFVVTELSYELASVLYNIGELFFS